jgi:tetratricopeptide (TPR) repeat protein
VKPGQDASDRWKRVCELSSLLLDSPKLEWSSLLDRECVADHELRAQVLGVCDKYSETDEFFGEPVVSPLVIEDSMIGQRIGAWKVLSILGEGGMGRVYLVERADGVFTQLAALKVIRHHSDQASIQRFHAERRILAMLDHPSIARAIDGGATATGTPYLVMEYVEGGQPIDEFCKQSPVRDKVRLFLQVVEALEATHKHQVAHRDLKPANILVTPGGLPKVLDFGVAKLFQEDLHSPEQTNAAHAAVTPTYASPEQLLREPSSLLSDIYSLGAVLYKMLTGRPPHDLTGLNILQSVRVVAESDPPHLSAHSKAVDADIGAVVMKAIERSPSRRYGSATEFAADLRRYLEGVPVKAREESLADRARRFVRRRRLPALAAAVCLLLALGAGTRALLGWSAENQRLEQLRKTARSVIAEYQSQLAKLSGNSVLLDRIASDEKKYLDGILVDATRDPDLRRLAASAYGSLAGYQSSDKFAAQDSLLKSVSQWREVLKGESTSADRLELAGALRRLGWSQINMGNLTEAGRALDEGMRLVNTLSGTPSEEGGKQERVTLHFELSRLGVWSGDMQSGVEHAQKVVAEIEKLPAQPFDRRGIAIARMQFADAAMASGPGNRELFDEALRQTRLAVKSIREGPACPEMSCREVRAAVLTRASSIMIHHELVEEALSLRDGVDLAEAILDEDPGNSSARSSLRLGLYYLGWALRRAGRLEECLRVRRRMLEISTISGRDPGPAEDRLNEAVACGEVGRVLAELSRLSEAQGYFERAAEILANPPNENVAWILRQTDVYRDLGLLHERRGLQEAARAEFARASAAAATYLTKTGSARAKAVEADAHYQQGRTLLAVNKAAGCRLLRQSLDRYRELTEAAGRVDPGWESNIRDATQAVSGCE